MNFEDEDYRRLYVRRTVTSKRLGWEGRAVRNEMLTEFDRAGVWEFTEDAAEDIADLVELPLEVVRVGLSRLLATRTWVMGEGQIIWPRLHPAQTCPRSDRIRQQERRERRRDEALAGAKTSQVDQSRHEPSQRSQPSRTVTPPSLALPPSLPPEPPERESPERARTLPEVPGLVKTQAPASPPHPGPLRPSRREQAREAEAARLGVTPTLRIHFDPNWEPNEAHRARGFELGLTEAQMLERAEDCRRKPIKHGFTTEDDHFFRELSWLAADLKKQRFQGQRQGSRHERDRFETPGADRAAR